jgi:WD40 repeat protein
MPGRVVQLLTKNSGIKARQSRGHDGPVFSVAFNPDGKMLASGGQDGAVKLWVIPIMKKADK